MSIHARLMTADEFSCLPDNGERHELVRGELRTMAPPMFPHGRSARRFGKSLDRVVDECELGEVYTSEFGYRLTTDPDTVRVPVVAFLSNQQLAAADDIRGYFPGAPVLVVEIVSPNDRYTEVNEKVAEWLEHGARLVFVVDPRRNVVVVHRPGQRPETCGIEDMLTGEDVVPGWSLAVRDLFA